MESATLQVNDLDLSVTSDQLEQYFSEFGPLKRCFVVKPKNKEATSTKGIVQFAIQEDVSRLFEETNGQAKTQDDLELNFVRISDDKNAKNIEVAKSAEQKKFDRQQFHKKKSRLIVRNLSFKATDLKLKSHFSTFGDVVDVNILKKKDGKMVGCAFIQYSNVKEAAQAIKELNGKPFLQRPIAIDWAVPKEQFQVGQPKKSEPEPEEDENEEVKENSENSENEESEENEESDENEQDYDDKVEKLAKIAEESGDELSDDEENSLEPEQKRPRYEKGHDIAENKTLFVRNISFNSDEEDLKDMMEQNFGRVIFAKFVIDKATEHPKGTAFVKFAEESSVSKAIEAAESKDGLWLDNRQIYAAPALRPDDAQKKKDEKKDFKKEKKDSRNLYLAREGLIREGTQAAIGVSKTDLTLRVQLEKRKKQMLKDLNRFISDTRLCIRNLPMNITDNAMKKLILKHVEEPGKITECKVMKDMKSGKSKGFAFVNFENHENALKTLRGLNNNPGVFSKDQRPIIEFSLENKKAINARQKRLEKSREKNPNFNKENVKKGPKMDKNLEKNEENENEDKTAFMGSKGKKGQTKMATHVGPKIRHKGPKISRKDIKKREKMMKNPKKRKAIKETLNFAEKPTEAVEKKAKKDKKPTKKSKSQIKDIREDKNFSKMVNEYKQKLTAASSKSGKKRKWFE